MSATGVGGRHWNRRTSIAAGVTSTIVNPLRSCVAARSCASSPLGVNGKAPRAVLGKPFLPVRPGVIVLEVLVIVADEQQRRRCKAILVEAGDLPRDDGAQRAAVRVRIELLILVEPGDPVIKVGVAGVLVRAADICQPGPLIPIGVVAVGDREVGLERQPPV